MSVRYQGPKSNYSNLDHFKEVAVKRINELYGRANPFDVFDFTVNKAAFICVAYHDGDEDIPEEVEEGTIVSEDEEEYTLKEILGATDAAMKLAEDNKLDLKQVVGTGAEGNITLADVRKYLKDNPPAPEEDNADDNTQENNE